MVPAFACCPDSGPTKKVGAPLKVALLHDKEPGHSGQQYKKTNWFLAIFWFLLINRWLQYLIE